MIYRFIFSVSENPTVFVSSSYLQKGGVLSFFFITREGSFGRNVKVLVPFLSYRKRAATRSPPKLIFIFTKVTDLNFEIAILFSIAEKSSNYVFENDLILQSSRGKATSYQLYPFVYIKYLLLGSIHMF